MEGIIHYLKRHRALSYLFLSNFFLSFHYFLVLYIGSPSLEEYFSEKTVGLIFMIGSIVTLGFFIASSKIIARINIYRFLLLSIIVEFLVVLALAFTQNGYLFGALFIIHTISIPMILYSLDIFLEFLTKNEGGTGEIRGVYLTIANITLIISQIIVGFILKDYTFGYVYFLSALFCIPLAIIVTKKLRGLRISPPSHINIGESIRKVFKDRDILHITFAQFILQFFYAWMVIYLPIYLVSTIGFSWSELGILFSIMLLPFMIFEIPIGWLADKKMGEKELAIFGFLIIAILSASFSLPKTPNFALWASLLFISRIGASIVEVTAESYFFKHVKSNDSGIISVFRMTRPLSFIIAPTIATISLIFLPFQMLFWILGAITLIGAATLVSIKDTL